MKRSIAFTAAAVLACSLMGALSANAEGESVKVNVTIADAEGNLVLAQESIDVTDYDKDGTLTIADALYCTHADKFSGGADGVKIGQGTHGLELQKLWGVDNGINYGFYVNNKMSNGVSDPIEDGSYLNAFIFRDTKTFADKYSYFDTYTENVEAGEEKELTLYRIVFDENYAPVPEAVAGAKITVNGEETDLVTDAEGKVKVKADKSGKNVVSALYDVSDTVKIVPPAAVLNVAGEEPEATEPATEAVETTTTEAPATTTTTTTAATTTTKAATTTKASTSKSGSPKTGDAGTGAAAAVIGVSAACAFALRRRNED